MVLGKEQRKDWMLGCKSKEGVRDGRKEVRSARWRKREKGWPAAVQEEDKKHGEVMAVMNSSWLISRSQVGVWRLDFNTGLWLQSACRKKTTRKKAHLQLFHTTITIVPVCPWWWDPTKRPCLACSDRRCSGRWAYNSQAFKIPKKSLFEYWIADFRAASRHADLLNTFWEFFSFFPWCNWARLDRSQWCMEKRMTVTARDVLLISLLWFFHSFPSRAK